MALLNEYFRVIEKIKTDKRYRKNPLLTTFIRWMHLVMKGEMENTHTID